MDEVQPVDAGYGRLVKVDMAQALDEWLLNGDNIEMWKPNTLTASERRSDHAMDRQGRRKNRQWHRKPHASVQEDEARNGSGR